MSESSSPIEDAIRSKVTISYTLNIPHSSKPPPGAPTECLTNAVPPRVQLTTTLSPTTLEIHNDSHLHAHHAAMRGSTSPETHFRVTVTSAQFAGKMQPARHRMVYALLKEEMAQQGGIHALQLKTRTAEEEENLAGKAAN